MRLLMRSAVAVMVLPVLASAGCGQPQPDSGESESSYFNTRDPAQLQQWASHVVVAAVVDRRAEEQIITAAPGGPEAPVAGPALYSYTFAVDEVLWSHAQAVLPLHEASEFVAWDSVDDSLRPGDEYVVSVADDLKAGQQVFGYLDAQPVGAVDLDELTAALATPSSSVDPDNRPAPGIPFADRLRRHITGGN